MGSAEDDTILMRSSDEGLSFVAIVPTVDPLSTDAIPKTYERINYWGNGDGVSMGINEMTVDGSVGNDKFYIDNATVAATLYGDIGKDYFQIGQQYRSDSIIDMEPEDKFATEKTTVGTYLSSGNTGTMSIYGGENDDEFLVLRNKAVLSLFGQNGDDSFTLKAFLLEKTDGAGNTYTEDATNATDTTDIDAGYGHNTIEYAVNAPVNIIGGAGMDTVKIIGTEGDDEFVVTDQGVYGAGLFASFEGVEALTIDGGEGNDTFHVLSTGSQFTTKIFGGLGSDDFDIGGKGEPITITSNDFKGHSGLISHSITAGTTDAAYNAIYAGNKTKID
jgi:hypothetical protein